MAKAHENLEVKDIEEPSGIVKASVCKDSGELSTLFCNFDLRGSRVYEELFIDGTQPTSNCTIHSGTNRYNFNNGSSANLNPADNNSNSGNAPADSETPPVTNNDTLAPPVVGSTEPSQKTENNNENNNSNSNNASTGGNKNTTHNSYGPGSNNQHPPTTN